MYLLVTQSVQLIGHILPCASVRDSHCSFVNADTQTHVAFLSRNLLSLRRNTLLNVSVYAINVYKWSGGVTPFILNPGTRRSGQLHAPTTSLAVK